MKKVALFYLILGLFVATMIGCDAGKPTNRRNPDSESQQNLESQNSQASNAESQTPDSLKTAREGFKSRFLQSNEESEPVDVPPNDKTFLLVQYESQVGKLAAYVTPDPKDGKKHPAIIWITGGDCNSIGDVWSPYPQDNDQSACVYRKSGLVMMFPSLRGGNENPGKREGFYGEVDDVLAAADYLEKLDYVDPNRIYLGGHSTGGTLVLLTSEISPRFRAVFSFGPVANPAVYFPDFTPFDVKNEEECIVRAPGLWLHCIESPVFVFEGTVEPTNSESLSLMGRLSMNSKIAFFLIAGLNHFNVLAPINKLIADKILQDTGETCNIKFEGSDFARKRLE